MCIALFGRLFFFLKCRIEVLDIFLPRAAISDLAEAIKVLFDHLSTFIVSILAQIADFVSEFPRKRYIELV